MEENLEFTRSNNQEQDQSDSDVFQIFENEEEIVTKKIANWSDEELPHFWEILADNPKRHFLSQRVVEAVLERGMRFIEENDSNFPDIVMMATAFQLHGVFRRQKPEDESIADKAFRAMIRLFEKYPKAGHELENLFDQNYTVRPDIFIEEVADVMWRPEKSQTLKQDLLFSLQYLNAFSNGAYNEAILNNLNFIDSGKYFKTGTFLEFIRQLQEMSRETNFSESGAEELVLVIKNAIDRKEGSYLLNVRAQQIYESFLSGVYERQIDIMPFELSNGVYGFHDGITLCISDSGDYKKLSHLKAELEDLENAPYPTARVRMSAVRTEILGLMHPVTSNDVKHVRITQSEEDLYDYSYLLRKPVREIIESEFGFSIPDLSLAEQFQFLNFIKTKEAKEIPSIQDFTKKFGKKGFKTFLSLEHGQDLGNDIIKLGEKLPKEAAEKLFSKYSELVDLAEQVEDEVRDVGVEQNTFFDHNKLEERLMRKARNVLVDFASFVSVAEKANESIPVSEILERLSGIQSELVLVSELIKQKIVTLESLDQVSVDEKINVQLTQQERGEMLAVYRQNHNGKYRGEHLEYLLRSFEQRIQGVDGRSASVFHILRIGSQIGAFVSTREFEDGSIYIDDLETNPSLMGSSVGFDLFTKVTDQYPQRTLTGHVWAGEENRALVRKYEQAGWIVNRDQVQIFGATEYYKAMRPPKITPLPQVALDQQNSKAA